MKGCRGQENHYPPFCPTKGVSESLKGETVSCLQGEDQRVAMASALVAVSYTHLIAVSIAQVLNFNAATIVMGIIMGANMPFSTPIGANPITMTLQGGYRFKDYTRVNLGLNILAAISVVIATPVFFPF